MELLFGASLRGARVALSTNSTTFWDNFGFRALLSAKLYH